MRADIMGWQAAALGLIRDQDATAAAEELWQPGDPAEGSPAGLLCFDEVQIADPFTALVLKGAPVVHGEMVVAPAIVAVELRALSCSALTRSRLQTLSQPWSSRVRLLSMETCSSSCRHSQEL